MADFANTYVTSPNASIYAPLFDASGIIGLSMSSLMFLGNRPRPRFPSNSKITSTSTCTALSLRGLSNIARKAWTGAASRKSAPNSRQMLHFKLQKDLQRSILMHSLQRIAIISVHCLSTLDVYAKPL